MAFIRSLWLWFLLAIPLILPLYQWRFPLFGVPTNALEVLVTVGIFSSLIPHLFVRLQRLPRRSSCPPRNDDCLNPLLSYGFLLLLAGALLGLTQSTDILSSLGIIKSYLLLPAGFFLTARYALSDANTRERLFQFLPFSLAFATIWMSNVAIAQVAGFLPIPALWQQEMRATGPFPYPNALGHVLAPMTAFALAWLFQKKEKRFTKTERWTRFALISAVLFGIVGTILAQTESALLALIIIVGVLTIQWLPQVWRPWAISAGILFAGILVATQSFIQEKLLLQDWSGRTRQAIWSETWQGLTAHPASFLLGFGPNEYPIAIAPFHTHTYLEIFQYPHQLFFNFWVEFGLLGILGLLMMVFSVAKTPSKNIVAISTMFALLEMLIHGMVDVPFLKNDLALFTAFFLMIGIDSQSHLQVSSPKKSLSLSPE